MSGFNVEHDPTKATEPVATHGVFDATIKDAMWEKTQEKELVGGKKIAPQHQMKLVLVSPKWDSDQFAWYAFADEKGEAVKAKGSKWMNLREQLVATGAENELSKRGSTGPEIMTNFCESLKGLAFTFEEFKNYPLGVTISDYLKARTEGTLEKKMAEEWKDNKRTDSQILPVKFLGRKELKPDTSPSGQFSTERVGSSYS